MSSMRNIKFYEIKEGNVTYDVSIYCTRSGNNSMLTMDIGINNQWIDIFNAKTNKYTLNELMALLPEDESELIDFSLDIQKNSGFKIRYPFMENLS